jgi:hypothetical protein
MRWAPQQGGEASWEQGFSVLVGWVGPSLVVGEGGAAWAGPEPGW